MKRSIVAIISSIVLLSSTIFADVNTFKDGVINEIGQFNEKLSTYFSDHLGFIASIGRVEPTAALPEGTIIPINLAISANIGIGWMGKINEVLPDLNVFTSTGISTDKGVPWFAGPNLYARVGINFIPFEVGFKIQPKISSPGFVEDKIGFSYHNKGYGFDVRTKLFGISLVLASIDLALGFSYNKMTGDLGISKSSLLNDGTIGSDSGSFTIDNFSLKTEWDIKNYDPYIRVGAKILIVRAYIELAYGINKTDVTTTISGTYTATVGNNSVTGDLNIPKTVTDTIYEPKITIGANIPLFIIVGFNIEGKYSLKTKDAFVNGAFTFIF